MKLNDLSKEQLIEIVRQLKLRKKFGLVWEEKSENVVEQCNKELPVLEEVKSKEIIVNKDLPINFLIEGDNYHALSVLNYTHTGKIDIIYIDPPYNTGSNDWKYNNDYVDGNDTYRHSKWLSMMNNRLQLTKNLLTSKGVLICTIDENEHATLGMLLNDIFPEREIVCITIVHNPGGIQGKNFSYTHEYAYFVYPKGGTFISNIERNDIAPTPLRDWGKESSLRTSAKNCFYPIIIKDDKIVEFGEVCDDSFHPRASNIKREDGLIEVYPIDGKGIERKWRFSRQSVETITDELIASNRREEYVITRAKRDYRWKTVWMDTKYSANVYGTKLLGNMISKKFPFPKSLYAVEDCIKAVIHDKKKSIILDFFAGSGTTGHAVLDLNKEDGGHRQFILCTNNENGIAEEVCYPRVRKVIKGYSDVEGIPANLKYFKTKFVKRSTVTDDTRGLLVRKSAEMICVKEGTFNEIVSSDDFKVFKDSKHSTGILLNLESILGFKKVLEGLKLPSNIYVFSLTNDTYNSDFEDLSVNHKLCPIPESILEVYRKLFKE